MLHDVNEMLSHLKVVENKGSIDLLGRKELVFSVIGILCRLFIDISSQYASLLKQSGLLTIHDIPITLIAFHKLWHGATFDIRDLVSLIHTGHLTLSSLQETITIITSKYSRRATIEKDVVEQRFRCLWTVLQGRTPVI